MHRPRVRNRSGTLLWVGALLCAAGAAGLWYLYFTLFWPYRDRFNEAGRHMDESTMVVYHEQAGLLLIPALVLSVLALGFACVWQRSRRRHKGAQ